MSHNIKNRTWPQSITWQCLVTDPEESERATALPVALKGWQQWWRPMIMNIRENMKMRKSGLPTNEIVELLPAPVDPTQMTHARGKERSLEKNIFKIAYIGSLSTCIVFVCVFVFVFVFWREMHIKTVLYWDIWMRTCEPACFPLREKATVQRPPSRT